MNKNCATYCYYDSSGCGLYHRRSNSERTLQIDFPFVLQAFVDHGVFKMHFYHHGNEALAWRDKHNNIMVRVFHVDTQLDLIDYEAEREWYTAWRNEGKNL